MSDESFRQMVRVAKLYYQYDYTQNEIANRLGLSRIKVHRILQTAKETGIVTVQINAVDSGYFDIENNLIKAFDLVDAVVVPTQSTQKDRYLALAKGTTEWLLPRLKADMRVGLGLGRTISHLPIVFDTHQNIDCIFTEVIGAASDHSQGFASYNITSKMAELIGGRAEFFYAPTFVSSPELKQDLTKEPAIQKALEKAQACDIILQSLGPVDESALLFVHGYINEQDLITLKNIGAVGDALGHFFDEDGNSLHAFTDDHVIGLELEDLRKTPLSVCIAGGPEKIKPIAAALKGNFFNVLITDLESAQALLKEVT